MPLTNIFVGMHLTYTGGMLIGGRGARCGGVVSSTSKLASIFVPQQFERTRL